MSNKAKNDKGSILVDVENLLDAFEPAFMLMPKIKRLHGAAVRMEDAAYDLIDHYSIAYSLTVDEWEEKKREINKMIGAYGRMQSCFKRLMKIDIDTQKISGPEAIGQMGMFSNHTKLVIAQCMERIEEGIIKWRRSIKAPDIISAGRSAQDEQEGLR